MRHRETWDPSSVGVRFGTERIVFMLVPFTMYLIFFAPCLITILAAGKFDASGLADTTLYLQWLSVALPFYGISTYLQKVCSSLRHMSFFAVATVIAAVVQVAFCMLFTNVFGLAGVAFSSALFFGAVDMVTFLHVRRQIGALGLKSMAVSFVRSLLLGMAGVAVAALVFAGLQRFLGPWGTSIAKSVLYCVCGGVPALLATYGLAVVLSVPEAGAVRALVGRLMRR